MTLKKWLIFIPIIIASFLFRLSLSPKAFHTDLISQAEWGERIYHNTAKNFYQSSVWTFSWPNHPPLTNLYYSFCYQVYIKISLRVHQSLYFFTKHHLSPPNSYRQFVNDFDFFVSPEKPFPHGYLFTLKIVPIIADILIAVLIFILTKSLLLPSIYLLSPFSFYLSSLWGQTDQIASLLTIIAFLILPKNIFFSLILFYLGGSLKPTSILLIPLYLFLTYKSRPKIIPLLLGLFTCLVLTFIIFGQYSSTQNIFDFTFKTLIPRLTDRPDRLTTNAFNFWHIFTLNQAISPNVIQKIFSYLIYFFINIIAFRKIKTTDSKSILISFFIVSFGSWLFLTNMLDRYSFAGILSGLILSFYYPKAFKYWLILSLIYWLNIFRGWWYPFTFLKDILTYRNYLVGLPLSIANCLLYWQIIRASK